MKRTISIPMEGEMHALDESVAAEIVRHSNCPLLVWSTVPQCPSVSE